MLTVPHTPTGQATRKLTPFRTVLGIDLSAKMIVQAQAQSQNDAGLPGQISFVQSGAETLPYLEDGSVGMVVSDQ